MKFPTLFTKRPDGGINSNVTGYFLIEWKPFFSIVLLKFNEGSREVFHNHAFNAVTWFLKGLVTEHRINKDGSITSKNFWPSLKPKYTPVSNIHRIVAHRTTWALSFRGPWTEPVWSELDLRSGKMTVLAEGRRVVYEHDTLCGPRDVQ